MTYNWINLNFGSLTNTGTGDDLRTAFTKVDNNLAYLKENVDRTFSNIGTGAEILVSDALSLKFKTFDSTNTNTVLTFDDENIHITTKDSINALSEDLEPKLSGNLDVNGFEIFNKNEEDVYTDLKLNDIILKIDGNKNVIFSSNELVLKSDHDITTDSNIITSANMECVHLSAESLTVTNNIIGNVVGNIIGNVVGDITGNTNGIHIGEVQGNVSGTVSDITNHSIAELSDVDDIIPDTDTVLVWNGTKYVPTNIIELISRFPLRLNTITSEQRDLLVPASGEVIYNTTDNVFQGYANGTWVNLG